MRRIVTFIARESCVLAFEKVSGFAVVKGLGVPLHQWEIFTVVFGVAACAFLARACGYVVVGVQSAVGG